MTGHVFLLGITILMSGIALAFATARRRKTDDPLSTRGHNPTARVNTAPRRILTRLAGRSQCTGRSSANAISNPYPVLARNCGIVPLTSRRTASLGLPRAGAASTGDKHKSCL
jgi:hypothetical protein